MAKSKLDEKREKRKKKEKKSPLSKAVELVVHTLKKALQIFIMIFIGTLVVAQSRLSQTGLLPDCITAEPYQDGDANPEQIHLDYISNKDNSGSMRSIKATYPINYNTKIIHKSYMFRVIKTLTKGPDSSTIGNYLGICLTIMTQSYISVHNSILSTLNSLLPELVIVLLGKVFIHIVALIAFLFSFVKGIMAFFQNVKYFYYDKELVDVDGSQETKWNEGKFGMWESSETWNWLWTVLIYISLLIGLTIIIPTCLLWTFLVGLTVFFMPFFLMRIYSTEDDINNAINKKADEMTHGGDGDIMKGGADDENEDAKEEQDGDENDGDEKKDDEKENEDDGGNASDEEGEVVNGQPHPGLPKRFSVISHFKKFIKVYRHVLLYIFAFFLISDVLSIFGTYAMAFTIFAIILVWYFGSLFQAYKIKDADKFTTFLMGATRAKKVCKVPFVPKKPEEQDDKKWYFLWLF